MKCDTIKDSPVVKFHPAFKGARSKLGHEGRFRLPTPKFAVNKSFASFPSFMACSEDRFGETEDCASSQLTTQRNYREGQYSEVIGNKEADSFGKAPDKSRLFDEITQLDTLIDEEIEYHHLENSQPAKPYEVAPIKLDLMTSYRQALAEIQALKQQIAVLDEREHEATKMNQKLLETIELQEKHNANLKKSHNSQKSVSPSKPVSLMRRGLLVRH
jgi:hypothetical protein